MSRRKSSRTAIHACILESLEDRRLLSVVSLASTDAADSADVAAADTSGAQSSFIDTDPVFVPSFTVQTIAGESAWTSVCAATNSDGDYLDGVDGFGF